MSEAVTGEMLSLNSLTDISRKVVNGKLTVETKDVLGQYMTSARIASFMASLFPSPSNHHIMLLDPGAGVGSLTSAFIERLCGNQSGYQIDVDAYEIDPVMCSYLQKNLSLCSTTAARIGSSIKYKIISEDFVHDASRKIASINSLFPEQVAKYTHCIMNPPYKKITNSSRHRMFLRTAGIETVNLYSAFVALSLFLLEKGGYLVAIIPRSFCNGPYYYPFRKIILKHAAMRRIHLFGARNEAFKEDNVLQENIVIVLEKGGCQDNVTVSTSTDDTFSDIVISEYSLKTILKEGDNKCFIHIPISPNADFIDDKAAFCCTLSQIGIQVSTGPVVDFRLREQLREMPEIGSVPLLYPCHFYRQCVRWPVKNGKKPNAIISNNNTQKWLYPNGFYTVVRRFSSKEEKRRIIASVVNPVAFGKAEKLGFENHLNVFHSNKEPLTEVLARGLAVLLNSKIFDESFRRFSGHTQVNATDLKNMKYPSREKLVELGKWAVKYSELSQDMIDGEIERILQ